MDILMSGFKDYKDYYSVAFRGVKEESMLSVDWRMGFEGLEGVIRFWGERSFESGLRGVADFKGEVFDGRFYIIKYYVLIYSNKL